MALCLSVYFFSLLFSLLQISLLLLKNISCSNPAFEEEDQRILRILNADLRVLLLLLLLLLVVVHVVAVAADS